MAVNIKLATVIVTALIDSINPCAIGVLVLLISTLLGLSKDKGKMVRVGILYVTVVFVTYFIAGLGLLFFIQKLGVADLVATVVGGVIILAGFIEMKDFFWYGQGFSLAIPPKMAIRIKKYMKKVTIPGVIFLGFFVAAVELPCTGGPYLAITALLAKNFDMVALWYLVLYNFIFVLPLIIIIIMAYYGTKMTAIKAWKTRYRKWMRLAIGLLLVGLGILLILYAQGIVSL